MYADWTQARAIRCATALSLALLSGAASCSRQRVPQADLDSQLLRAAEAGDLVSARRLLKGGADVNSKESDGTTALMLAAGNDRTEVVRLLVDKGATVSAQNIRGESAMSEAAEFARAPTLQLLLDHGADPTAPLPDRMTPLDKAAKRENADAVALFVAHGASLEQKNRALAAAAHGLAILTIQVPIADSAGKNKEAPPPTEGQPNLSTARTIQILLQNGAQIESKSKEYGEDATPLTIAATWGNTDAVQALLESGADVDATDSYGDTGLIAAACDCAAIDMPDTCESMKLLLEKHANPNLRNKKGETALMAAVTWSRTENMELLLDHGAAIDAKDEEGNTALMIAASGGAIDLSPAVKLLIQRGSNRRLTNKSGETALMIARKNRFDDAVRLLLR